MLLLVDDDPRFLDIALEQLDDEGRGILLARNGEQAKRLIRDRESEISMVLVDLDLPGQDGFSLIRELRETCPDVPAIAISGVIQRDALESAKLFGAVAALRKPIDREWRVAIVRARAERYDHTHPVHPPVDHGIRLQKELDRAHAEYIRVALEFQAAIDEIPSSPEGTARIKTAGENQRRALQEYERAVKDLSRHLLGKGRRPGTPN